MKIKIDLKRFIQGNQKVNWQKSFFGVIVVSIIVFIIGCFFIVLNSVDPQIKKSIDQEVKSTDVIFDLKTLKMIKERVEIPTTTNPKVGKNPFKP